MRHPIFQRQNYDIYSTAPISFVQAAIGGDVRIKTVDGDVLFNIKPGTQTDTKIRLRGKGVPNLRNKTTRGDHYVTLVVQVPEKLTSEQKEALMAFDAAMGGTTEDTKNNATPDNDSESGKESGKETVKEEKKKKKGFFGK